MADRRLHLMVVTLTGPLADVPDASWVQARLADGGSIGIYPGHAPLLAETQPGALRYASRSAGEASLELEGGILQVERERVTVFTAGRLGAVPTPADDGAERFDRLAQALVAGLGADPGAVTEG